MITSSLASESQSQRFLPKGNPLKIEFCEREKLQRDKARLIHKDRAIYETYPERIMRERSCSRILDEMISAIAKTCAFLSDNQIFSIRELELSEFAHPALLLRSLDPQSSGIARFSRPRTISPLHLRSRGEARRWSRRARSEGELSAFSAPAGDLKYDRYLLPSLFHFVSRARRTRTRDGGRSEGGGTWEGVRPRRGTLVGRTLRLRD